jgi:signal transduction histidine kinase
MYFAIGEALQNVAKYAQASVARVTLRGDGRRLTFTVDDKGFDPVTARMGTGVQSMTDRMAALGGTLEIRSGPGEGTVVTSTIPELAERGAAL